MAQDRAHVYGDQISIQLWTKGVSTRVSQFYNIIYQRTKLASWFYDPFTILKCIGSLVYQF